MQVYARDGRPLPLITPLSRPFFDAARDGRLVLQKCPRDGFFFYPRSHCPGCLGVDWRWEEARRSGLVHSFTIERMGQDPGMRVQLPFVIALVDLAEGPRLVGQLVDCAPAEIAIGMQVQVFFEIVEGVALIRFRPAQA